MSRIIRFFKTLKNNPKKSIFFSGLGAFGIKFADGKYNDHLLMQTYCEEALKYGEQIQRLGDIERHITVILNPAANEGNCRLHFDRYCAPLLHLAGIKVALVKTEHEGQARDYMAIMENTSAVVVAGGDGTLAEVVTGLMRREDHPTTSKRLPLGLLPLGKKNDTASSIWGFVNTPEVFHLAESTMAVIKNVKRPLDIIEITPLSSSTDEIPKPVYAVSGIEWSAFRDAEDRKDKYWYWPFVKKYVTYVFSSYKDINWKCDADLEYQLPCSGCSNCYQIPAKIEADIPVQPNRKWWQAFLPKFTVQPIKENGNEDDDYVEEDRSGIINSECGTLYKTSVTNICDLRICSTNLNGSSYLPGHSISIKTGFENITSFEFIKEGWNRVWYNTAKHDNEIIVGEITMKPMDGVTTDSEGKARELNIDNDTFDIRPMKIRAIPRALRIFAEQNVQ